MRTIAEIISRSIVSETIRPRAPKMELYSPPVSAAIRDVPADFQESVLSFLCSARERLGIKEVFRCQNLRVDGAIVLAGNAARLAVEIKYKMNWEKACQACAEIEEFLRFDLAKQFKPTGAIVVFEEFSGDWARKQGRKFENGWNYWYGQGQSNVGGHSRVKELRVDLVRFRASVFEDFPG